MILIDQIPNGETSNIHRVFLFNENTGAGITGLDESSSGLVISTIGQNEATATNYTVAAGNVEAISTLGTYSAPTASKCRFEEVDATNMPGVYELQFANARLAISGNRKLTVSIYGATDLADFIGVIDHTVTDVNTTQVSGDATAADNLESAFDGGSYDIGGLDVSELNSVVDDWLNGGRLDLILDNVLADTNELQSDDIPATLATINGIVNSILADTDELQTDDIPGTLAGLDTLIDAIKAKTDLLGFTSGNVDANIVKVAGGTDLAAAGSGNQEYGES